MLQLRLTSGATLTFPALCSSCLSYSFIASCTPHASVSSLHRKSSIVNSSYAPRLSSRFFQTSVASFTSPVDVDSPSASSSPSTLDPFHRLSIHSRLSSVALPSNFPFSGVISRYGLGGPLKLNVAASQSILAKMAHAHNNDTQPTNTRNQSDGSEGTIRYEGNTTTCESLVEFQSNVNGYIRRGGNILDLSKGASTSIMSILKDIAAQQAEEEEVTEVPSSNAPPSVPSVITPFSETGLILTAPITFHDVAEAIRTMRRHQLKRQRMRQVSDSVKHTGVAAITHTQNDSTHNNTHQNTDATSPSSSTSATSSSSSASATSTNPSSSSSSSSSSSTAEAELASFQGIEKMLEALGTSEDDIAPLTWQKDSGLLSSQLLSEYLHWFLHTHELPTPGLDVLILDSLGTSVEEYSEKNKDKPLTKEETEARLIEEAATWFEALETAVKNNLIKSYGIALSVDQSSTSSPSCSPLPLPRLVELAQAASMKVHDSNRHHLSTVRIPYDPFTAAAWSKMTFSNGSSFFECIAQHGLLSMGILPFDGIEPHTKEPIRFQSFDEELASSSRVLKRLESAAASMIDKEKNKERALMKRLKAAFDNCIFFEKQYHAMLSQVPKSAGFPDKMNLSWGHILAAQPDVTHNIARWERIVNTRILPTLSSNLSILTSLSTNHPSLKLAEWAKKYRVFVRELLSILTVAIELQTATQNQRILNHIQTLTSSSSNAQTWMPSAKQVHTLEEMTSLLLLSTPIHTILLENSTPFDQLFETAQNQWKRNMTPYVQHQVHRSAVHSQQELTTLSIQYLDQFLLDREHIHTVFNDMTTSNKLASFIPTSNKKN